ncbi:MAG: DUF1572 family protein [Cyclobacteriaceae bacterium]|nr:DUF1572 family protein [Cyclobacteriaceae bacterium]
MFLDSLYKLFERDLNKLEEEIKLYPGEELIWAVQGDIKNSAGNLCLHLCGNLQHYIGKNIGGAYYVRNRELEFSARNIPQIELLQLISTTREIVLATLLQTDSAILEKEYPEKVFSYSMSHAYFLIHLEGHLNYHLGQINYHRRLVQQ